MNAKEAWNSHEGSPRIVQLEDQTFHHLHCIRCQRDFVRQSDTTDWKATHLGVFRFNLLDDDTNRRWASEPCPGVPRAAELNDRRRALPKAAKRPVTFVARQSAKVPLVHQADPETITAADLQRAT